MTVRKLEQNGDISTSGEQFITVEKEIGQTVETRLKLFLGEYFRDITDGTSWFEDILGKGQNEMTRHLVIKRRILKTIGVISLYEFSSSVDPVTRKYSLTAGIITATGNETINLSGVV